MSDQYGDVDLTWEKDEDLDGGLYEYTKLYTAEQLAARVAQAQAEEREACAKVCDAASKREDDMGAILGRAIRARGEQSNG